MTRIGTSLIAILVSFSGTARAEVCEPALDANLELLHMRAIEMRLKDVSADTRTLTGYESITKTESHTAYSYGLEQVNSVSASDMTFSTRTHGKLICVKAELKQPTH